MSERDRYEPGVPCWTDQSSNDPDAAFAFYRELYGWEGADQMPPEAGARYFMCQLEGRDVAGVGSQPESSAGAPPAWNTYVAVDDADAAAERAAGAGGAVLMQPFDVFDAGRMAVLSDPGGAVVFVWQAIRHVGARRVNEPGAMVWNELNTRDVEAAARFYGAVFGWRSLDQPVGEIRYLTFHLPGEGEPEPGSAIAGLLPMADDQWPAGAPSHWTVYFGTDDTDATVARVQELGGGIAVEPFDTPAGRIAAVSDPSGATFSVISLAPVTA